MVIEHYKDLQNRNTRPRVCGKGAGILVWWYEKKSDSAFFCCGTEEQESGIHRIHPSEYNLFYIM
jgi:ribosomal protein L34E